MSDRRITDPPDVIYLQWYGDGDPDNAYGERIDPMDVSWCADKIFPHDVAYVRVDASTGTVSSTNVPQWQSTQARLAADPDAAWGAKGSGDHRVEIVRHSDDETWTVHTVSGEIFDGSRDQLRRLVADRLASVGVVDTAHYGWEADWLFDQVSELAHYAWVLSAPQAEIRGWYEQIERDRLDLEIQ